MARKLKTDLWKKSYLREFVDQSGALQDAFTFSVPPESEEITYSQRKSETKTFGGLHVDDYGLDAVKISLSGSTVNQDLKKIYNPKRGGADRWMTGEQEIYYLRNLIHTYKWEHRAKEIRIMLYDLSKISYIKGQASDGTKGGVIKNYWRVFPGDFKIRRASDRPFTYKYSIEFTGVDLEDSENKANILAPKLDWAKTALDKIKGGVAWLENTGIMQFIENKNALLEEFDSSVRDITDILDAYADVLMGYVDGVTNMIDTGTSILSIPGDISQKVLNIGLNFMNAGKRLLKSVEKLTDTIKSAITVIEYKDDTRTVTYWAPKEILDKYCMTATEYADTCTNIGCSLEDYANKICSISKSSDVPNPMPGESSRAMDLGSATGGYSNAGSGSSGSGSGSGNVPGGGGLSDGSGGSESAGGGASGNQNSVPRQNIVLSYGYFSITLTSTDSLESLAAQFYGSPDMAICIAAYNGIASLHELGGDGSGSSGLAPGDTIRIPILSIKQRNAYNRIYARPEDRDNYGRDIYLDDKGYTAASTSGDYKLTDGIANLNQAILLRLRESVNKRIRLNAYGIRTNISDPTAGVAYIISSIDLTVRMDPRVSAVDNIRFTGVGDGLHVTVEYTDINHVNGSAAGRA
jgi:uncharacterized membrane protein YgcG